MTISSRKKWRLALVCGIAVPSLALASCSSDDDAKDTDSSASDSGSSSDGGSKNTADIELAGAPEGFKLTKPGSKLKIGESAYVVTQRGSYEGVSYPLEFWKVTAQQPHDVAVEDIPMTSDTSDIEKFVCMNYDVEFLGVGPFTPDEDPSIVSDPDMDAVDDNGRSANSVIFSDGSECGIHESDKLPSSQRDIQIGKVYKGAELSYVAKGTQRGISPTGLAFEFDVETPGLENADNIYWN